MARKPGPCRCEHPATAIDPTTGARFCDPERGGCDGEIQTPRTKLLEEQVIGLTREHGNLSRRFATFEQRALTNGNGAAPDPPGLPPQLAEEIAERVRFAPKRIALRYEEAAKALGMGETSFRQYVLPHVRIFRQGTLRLVPVAELERFLGERVERPLSEQIDPPERTRA